MNKPENRGGGRPSFGGSRPTFHKKSWGNNRGGDKPMTLYKATCADCGKIAEVPFRPSGDKPVYCKECFAKMGGFTGGNDRVGRNDRNGGRGEQRFPKRDFGSRDSRGPAKPSFENSRSADDIKKQLEAVNVKLDKLIRTMESMAPIQSASIGKKAGLTEALAAATIVKKTAKKKVSKTSKK